MKNNENNISIVYFLVQVQMLALKGQKRQKCNDMVLHNLFIKEHVKGAVHPAVFKGNTNFRPQILLLEPKKYINPILRPSVTSNL